MRNVGDRAEDVLQGRVQLFDVLFEGLDLAADLAASLDCLFGVKAFPLGLGDFGAEGIPLCLESFNLGDGRPSIAVDLAETAQPISVAPAARRVFTSSKLFRR